MNSPGPINPLRYNDVAREAIPTGEELLDRTERPYRVWVPKGKCIVLGNSQEPEKELNVAAVARDGIPVFKRMSGGGAVLLSPGCLCIGLRFAKNKALGIHDFFARGSGLITNVIQTHLQLELTPRGTSDLAYGDRKVAGCAMYMPRDFVLYLVSLMIDPDFSDIEKYLSHPSKEPDYRGARSHRDFLAGIGPLSGRGVTPELLLPIFEKETPAFLGRELDWEKCEENRPD